MKKIICACGNKINMQHSFCEYCGKENILGRSIIKERLERFLKVKKTIEQEISNLEKSFKVKAHIQESVVEGLPIITSIYWESNSNYPNFITFITLAEKLKEFKDDIKIKKWKNHRDLPDFGVCIEYNLNPTYFNRILTTYIDPSRFDIDFCNNFSKNWKMLFPKLEELEPEVKQEKSGNYFEVKSISQNFLEVFEKTFNREKEKFDSMKKIKKVIDKIKKEEK